MRLFVSPVGTSTITNFVKRQKIDFPVYSFANLKKDEYKPVNLADLNVIYEALKEQASGWSIEEAQKASAELNGLLSFDTNYSKEDMLFFVVTDTYQSNLAYKLVNTFLKSNFGIEGQKIRLKSLTTKNKNDFIEGQVQPTNATISLLN
jgi:CRISPR/Cas system-associated protein Csm6